MDVGRFVHTCDTLGCVQSDEGPASNLILQASFKLRLHASTRPPLNLSGVLR
jgi:hypothetical protein